MSTTYVEGDMTEPCLDDNIWDRWSVVVIPTEDGWANHWQEVARAVADTVGPRHAQLVSRFAYDGDRSGYRISDFWGCTSRPPTQTEAEACFAALIATGWADVVVSDCGQPLPDPDPVGPPVGVQVGSVTDTTAVVSWTAPAGQVDGYSYVVTSGETPVASGDTTVTTLPLDNLTAATAYTVVVTAKRGTETASAAPVDFTTTGAAPAARTATQAVRRKATASE